MCSDGQRRSTAVAARMAAEQSAKAACTPENNEMLCHLDSDLEIARTSAGTECLVRGSKIERYTGTLSTMTFSGGFRGSPARRFPVAHGVSPEGYLRACAHCIDR